MRPGDRYELIRALKRGGMAEVYEAIMRSEGGLELRVALKRLLPESVTDESLVSGFVDEARIVSRLSHANIVRIIDFGLIDGAPFQAQELVDGLDLVDLVERARDR